MPYGLDPDQRLCQMWASFYQKCLNILPVLLCHLLLTDANNCSIIFQNLLPSCENSEDPNQPADQDLYCLHLYNLLVDTRTLKTQRRCAFLGACGLIA